MVLATLPPLGAFAGSYVIATWSMPADLLGTELLTVFGALNELWVADAPTSIAYEAIAPIPVRTLPPGGSGRPSPCWHGSASSGWTCGTALRRQGRTRPPPRRI